MAEFRVHSDLKAVNHIAVEQFDFDVAADRSVDLSKIKKADRPAAEKALRQLPYIIVEADKPANDPKPEVK